MIASVLHWPRWALLLTLFLAPCVQGCRSHAPASDSNAAGPEEPSGQSSAPGPARTDFTFRGNRTFAESRLRRVVEDAVLDLVRAGYHRAAADDGAFELQAFYQDQGFPKAVVTAASTTEFVVEEGKRVVVRSVRFEGNQGLEDERLAALLQGPRTGFFEGDDLYYSLSSAESLPERARRLYVEQGWLEAEVRAQEPKFTSNGRGVRLTYQVEEGVRARLQEVRFEGGDPVPLAALEALGKPFLGRPWNNRLAWELRGRIAELYGDLGRPGTQIEFETSQEGPAEVRLLYRIQPGEEVRISEILWPEGLQTRPSTLREFLALEEGDLFRLKDRRRSLQRLYGSGLFRSVDLRLGEVQNGRAPLRVEAVESKSLEAFVEPGYGSYEGLRLRFGAREKNFLGRALTLRGDATVGFLAQTASLGFSDPRLLGTELDFDLAGFVTRREEPAFLRREFGGTMVVGRTFDRNWRAIVGYELRHSEAREVEVTDPEVLASLEDVDVSSISLSPTFDSRDSLFLPSEGTFGNVVLQYSGGALGSELDFLRLRGTLSRYFSLSENDVIAASLRIGLIWALADTEQLPLQERFFNGGENSVRSFRQDELGPRDANDNPIGGEAFNLISVEYRRTLWKQLQGALFVDVGNVSPKIEDELQFDDLRSAVGLGLRWVLPIGPVRLDAGFNPDPRSGEDDFAVHLSVGLAF